MSLRLNLAQRYPRNIWLLCATSTLGAAGHLGLRQLLIALYMLRLGFGVDTVGATSAVGSISFSLASVPGGALGARFGPRKVMLLGILMNLIGMGMMPLTEMMPEAIRVAWIMLGLVIDSAGWSFYSVNNIASIASFTGPEGRRGAYALSEAFSGLGSFSGAFVGGLLPGIFANWLGTTTEFAAPYRYALWAAPLFALLALAPLFVSTPAATAPRNAKTEGRFRVGLPLALLALTVFLSNGAYASSRAFGSAYLDTIHRLPTSLIGAINSVAMFLAIITALSSQRIARGRSSGRMMALASLGVSASMLCMGLVPHWLGAALGIVGVHTVLALWRPSFQALQMEIADPAWRSMVSGATAMSMSLGFGSVSYSGGLIVKQFGYQSEFLLGAVLAVASGVVVMLLQSRLHRAPMVSEV